MFKFQALRSRRFQHGFYRVNLHRFTVAHRLGGGGAAAEVVNRGTSTAAPEAPSNDQPW
jgi:hypothetical protein